MVWMAALAAAIAGTPAATAKPPANVEAFAHLPAMSSPSLSPDGRHFAAIEPINGRPGVAIYQVGAPAGARPVMIPVDDWLVYRVRWVSNERLMIAASKPARYWFGKTTITRGLFVSPDGGNPVRVLGNVQTLEYNGSGTSVVDLMIDDPEHILMRLMARSTMGHGRVSLFRVNLKTGNGRKVELGGPDTGNWLTDGRGNLVARVDYTNKPRREKLLVRDGDNWREIASADATADSALNVTGLSADGRAAIRVARVNGREALAAIDLTTGAETLLYQHPARDLGAVLEDEWTGKLVGVKPAGQEPPVYFDADRKKAQAALNKAFAGHSARQIGANLDRSIVIVAADSPRFPATFYFLDRKTGQASEIMSSYPSLSEDDLGEMKAYNYEARDGLTIPAFITLPPGRAAKNLPAVVMPHGGPDSADELGFDWWAQFMANRGYVVLQPNFRGSSGYGRAFTEAGLQQWGLKMQDDISDGVLKMIADGIADPKRVCIVGASYGGYAALAGATLTPELYACVVAVAPVTDLPEMLNDVNSAGGRDSFIAAFWRSRIGDLSKDRERLEATSPTYQAKNVKAPILLMHGVDDVTVPIEQSEFMARALDRHGKTYKLVRFRGDDHYLQLGATRLTMLKELEAFLKAHIGG